MTTREITFHLSLALLLCMGVVHAGEFSMSSGSMLAQVSTPVQVERDVATGPAAPISAGADSSSRFMRSAGVESTPGPGTEIRANAEPTLDSISATPSKAEDNARMGGAPAASAAPNRSRNGNRWQSLVPGAIK